MGIMFTCLNVIGGMLGDKRNGLKTYGRLVSVNTSRKWYVTDPFVLATQAEQVFYIGDPRNGSSWKIVQKVCPRNVYNVPENEKEDERLIMNDEPFQQYEISDVDEIEQINAENMDSLLREDALTDEIDASIIDSNKKSVQRVDDDLADEEYFSEEEDDTVIDYCDDDTDDKEKNGDDTEDDEDDGKFTYCLAKILV